jgi:hypothetical protein
MPLAALGSLAPPTMTEQQRLQVKGELLSRYMDYSFSCVFAGREEEEAVGNAIEILEEDRIGTKRDGRFLCISIRCSRRVRTSAITRGCEAIAVESVFHVIANIGRVFGMNGD